MRTWLYLIHPPREDFIATITPDEAAIMGEQHSPYLARLLDEGTLILAGPTWGQPWNDGVAIVEAADEEAARAIMEADPAITSGLMVGELREMRVSYLRGRA
ncbi:YciI family protein [Nocardioides sp. Kera G14]|uniref:YciI family protein n=1 Tax=Nocardioides sp. Kera G14 TaxID=2884264 RepID=UPI001D10D6C8|nr:YciI family protein [Nocardioides sp. Kera G14]UDY22459.1 YciI family protein [Nocardioides sp. Kera G14]